MFYNFCREELGHLTLVLKEKWCADSPESPLLEELSKKFLHERSLSSHRFNSEFSEVNIPIIPIIPTMCYICCCT